MKNTDKALEVLKTMVSISSVNMELFEYGLLDGVNEVIEELEEAMKSKTCEGCKWEQETKLITTNVGYKIDICKLCTRYENFQDRYEPKDNT